MSTRAETNAIEFPRLQVLRRQGLTAEAIELRQRLIRRNAGIAKALGWKFETAFEIAGARLIAFKLLGMSVDTFDPGTGRPFTRFAVKFIRRQLLRLWTVQQVEENQRLDTAATERDLGHLAELLDQLDAVDRFDGNMVRRYFGIGRAAQTFADIGRELGLSHQLISRHVRRGIKQLRQFSQDEQLCKRIWDPRKEVRR